MLKAISRRGFVWLLDYLDELGDSGDYPSFFERLVSLRICASIVVFFLRLTNQVFPRPRDRLILSVKK